MHVSVTLLDTNNVVSEPAEWDQPIDPTTTAIVVVTPDEDEQRHLWTRPRSATAFRTRLQGYLGVAPIGVESALDPALTFHINAVRRRILRASTPTALKEYVERQAHRALLEATN